MGHFPDRTISRIVKFDPQMEDMNWKKSIIHPKYIGIQNVESKTLFGRQMYKYKNIPETKKIDSDCF